MFGDDDLRADEELKEYVPFEYEAEELPGEVCPHGLAVYDYCTICDKPAI